MSIGILLMLILSSLLMVLSSSKAEAQTIAIPCDAELKALSEAITQASFTNPDKDQQSLLAKVDAARDKLSKGKTADAIAKIQDIELAVYNLAGAGKLDKDDAAAIVAAAEAAIACISSISSA